MLLWSKKFLNQLLKCFYTASAQLVKLTSCWRFLKFKKFHKNLRKELSFWNKFKFSNPYIFTIWRSKQLIFQTYIIWSIWIYSLKYLRSTTLESKDIWIRKAEFVAKTQFLYYTLFINNWRHSDQNKVAKIWKDHFIKLIIK